jgi:hypothetical protein
MDLDMYMDIMMKYFINVYKIDNHYAIRRLVNMGWCKPEYLVSIPPRECHYIGAGFTVKEREALGFNKSNAEKKKQD